ncbi:MAG: hypothetical protein V1928_05255 [Parcubacteria group bacterium]
MKSANQSQKMDAFILNLALKSLVIIAVIMFEMRGIYGYFGFNSNGVFSDVWLGHSAIFGSVGAANRLLLVFIYSLAETSILSHLDQNSTIAKGE